MFRIDSPIQYLLEYYDGQKFGYDRKTIVFKSFDTSHPEIAARIDFVDGKFVLSMDKGFYAGANSDLLYQSAVAAFSVYFANARMNLSNPNLKNQLDDLTEADVFPMSFSPEGELTHFIKIKDERPVRVGN